MLHMMRKYIFQNGYHGESASKEKDRAREAKKGEKSLKLILTAIAPVLVGRY